MVTAVSGDGEAAASVAVETASAAGAAADVQAAPNLSTEELRARAGR